jgi:hypothetical protein
VLLGLMVLVGAACVAPAASAPYYGITFNVPSVGYIGQTYTPKATATSKLPVALTLDGSSAGCSFSGGVLSYDSLGTCVINANEPGDATHAASKQVQRKITIHACPPLVSGLWTGPDGLSANVIATVLPGGSSFTGTVDLSSLGGGVQSFNGTVNCQTATMTFDNVPLTGTLSFDGSTLSSSYDGIAIVLHAPVTPA